MLGLILFVCAAWLYIQPLVIVKQGKLELVLW